MSNDATSAKAPVVIVGSGLAGYEAAKDLLLTHGTVKKALNAIGK